MSTLPDHVEVIRRRVKRLRLQVHPDGRTRLICPQSAREKDVYDFYASNAQWVTKKHAEYAAARAQAPTFCEHTLLLFGETYTYTPSTQHQLDHTTKTIMNTAPLADPRARYAWYRNFAKEHLGTQLSALAQKHGYTFQKVTVRDPKTRWGSCSAKGNISLSWRLVLMPKNVCTYVLCHELAHLREHNHSARFWAHVEQTFGDSHTERLWLKTHGQGVFSYLPKPS